MITIARLTTFLMLFSMVAGNAMAQNGDVPGSRDHPLVSRYVGATIIDYDAKAYDAYTLPLGPTAESDGKQETLEGRVTTIRYIAPEGRSTLEVYRNYEDALQQAGFEILFACAGAACGRHFTNVYKDRPRDYLLRKGEDRRFLAARAPGAEADVYVALFVNHHTTLKEFAGRPIVQLDVIEIEPLDAGKVTVDAEALAKGLGENGHVAVYGLYFDVDEALVKPESKPALDEIARLLAQEADLKLYVVGHTDHTGPLAHNVDLSQRRAEAVVERLVADYGVAADRLAPVGVGPVAPVASNRTEAGRSLNRRVELTAQ